MTFQVTPVVTNEISYHKGIKAKPIITPAPALPCPSLPSGVTNGNKVCSSTPFTWPTQPRASMCAPHDVIWTWYLGTGCAASQPPSPSAPASHQLAPSHLPQWLLSPPPYSPRTLSPCSQHHVHPRRRLPWLTG